MKRAWARGLSPRPCPAAILRSAAVAIVVTSLLYRSCQKTKGPRSASPWPSSSVRHGLACPWHPASYYTADAPGRPGSARRINPSSISGVVVIRGEYRSGGARRQATARRSSRPLPETLGADDQGFHGADVVTHRLLGATLVPLPDGLQHTPVVLVRADRPPRRVQRLLAALPEQIHDAVHETRDGLIVRGRRDGRVELGILGQPGASRRDLLRLLVENPFHLLEFLGSGPASGQRSDDGLEQAARFEELSDGFALREHHHGQ